MKIFDTVLILILAFYRFNQQSTSDSTESNEQGDMVENSNIDDTSKQYNNTDDNPNKNTKIILIGFENYKIDNNNNITFNVIFKRIYGNISPEKLKITLNIFNEMLRNLKEEKKTIECLINNANEGSNKIIFNCSFGSELVNITKVSAEKNFSLVNGDGIPYNNNILKALLSVYADRKIDNIQNEKEPLDFIILYNSTKAQDQEKFDVVGFIDEKINDDDDNNVILFINTKNISCTINEINPKYYDLECPLNESISFKLENIVGQKSNQILIISMREGLDDTIVFPPPNTDYNNKKYTNRGLSDGAIAAIVIGCVFTVISITIVIMLLRKRKVNPRPKISSQVDIYTNVSKSSQQKIDE